MSQGSSGSKVTDLQAGQLGFDSWQGQGLFCVSAAVSSPTLGPTHSPVKWVLGFLSLWGEVAHSPPSSTKVKNTWIYIPTPLYVFMAWYLFKHRENFFKFIVTDFFLSSCPFPVRYIDT
jgi:hypothetical protein